eukprot:GCRY01000501.1.p1 GENE.GCRY01000501.1~~GCRY01000501.1.p1  ORF type:complete len:149 (+),score=29.75 GCRY01000501.1:161-607(+)
MEEEAAPSFLSLHPSQWEVPHLKEFLTFTGVQCDDTDDKAVLQERLLYVFSMMQQQAGAGGGCGGCPRSGGCGGCPSRRGCCGSQPAASCGGCSSKSGGCQSGGCASCPSRGSCPRAKQAEVDPTEAPIKTGTDGLLLNADDDDFNPQ